MTLWFKNIFVADILSGAKRDTMRPISSRKAPRPGDRIKLSVGPRPAFAEAVVESVEIITLRSLPEWRRAQVLACYPDAPPQLRRIAFRVVRAIAPQALAEQRAP